ncbi:MAG TPA: zf-HC2 domain-containing protein [Pyrinomonadaceae bacterium]|jgi:anti-sigma factor RsiW
MNCAETQKSFSAYLDGRLPGDVRALLSAHLEQCPLCRLQLAETRAIVRGLAQLERPQPPAALVAAISDTLMIERAARRQQPQLSLWEIVADWVRPRVMPYTVGALTSILLFMAVSSALRPHMGLLRELARANRADADEVRLAVLHVPGQPTDMQALMPSLNPDGALAKLVRTPSTGRADDDDMAIVADVFSNGDAALAEVVQTPRNRHMLYEVEAALRQTPAFLPAARDQRPQTMRVVLSISKVNVQDRTY